MGTGAPPEPWTFPAEVGPGCEPIAHGFLREPVSAWSSLVFVAAAAVLVVLARRRRAAIGPASPEVVEPPSAGYAAMVAGIGVGSFLQHGPDPPWADLAHDLPLLATVVLITVDAGADLLGRRRRWWSWVLPTLALVPVIQWLPRAGDVTQVVLAFTAVLISAVRAVLRPPLRRPIAWTVALLAVAGTVEIMSGPGWPWCDPHTRWWFGHAIWHTGVAAALVVLTPALGWRGAGAGSTREAAPDG